MVVAMLLAAALVVAPAAAGTRNVISGATVYVGEENVTLGFAPGANQIVHYSDPTAGAIDKTISLSPAGVIPELTSTAVGTVTGPYYVFDNTGDPTNRSTSLGYINVQYPEVKLDVVLNTSQKDSVAGKSVTRDNLLDFKLTDNILNLTDTINIEVTMPGGGTTTQFGGKYLNGTPLTGGTSYIGPVNLSTAEAGTYTAIAKWPSTSDFYGKGFDSNTVTFEVSTKKLVITSDKDSVVRGKTFSVTVTGESKKTYNLFIKDVSSINENEYPFILPGQNGVTPGLGGPAKDHRNVNVTTTAGGTRTVQFNTNSTTDDRQFTIRVEDPTDTTNYDEVKVKVEKGAVTITAAGTGTYYIGEEITLEGTCTESDYVYLFLTGPNLNSNGVELTGNMLDVVNDNPVNFTSEVVEADDTWSYKWNTADLDRSLDSGGYTIYAVSAPKDKDHLSEAEYDTISIQLRSGFISATSSGAVVAKGDDLKLTGIAQGDPDEVQVWIFGKNKQDIGSATVEDDGSFEFELKGADTKDYSAGQYFVVIQHPMMNGQFDISAGTGFWDGWIVGTLESGFNPVKISGLQASDAANALIKALDSPNIDDTYVKLTFVVEEPRILIDPIGDVPAGSTFTISGTTNLAVGDTLNVEVTSAAFTPTEKGEAAGFASVARTTEVKAGDGANVWSVEIDGSNFKPDQYIVKVECIETDTTATANFNVIEAVPTTPTVTPTETVTTTTPPATTTVPPTETETPGFGALLALAGLGAVAYLVLRRD
ncbi:MEMAR_RS02690 family S-layer glycoprotein [Methanoculleus receptaculi]|uniref:MEMAR_RS02690 family S-layer glycoprotein n=1 Tax=Methanoculleus receptaculi TaxID=394967 RepID=A0AAX4FXS5_9EURY|nr:MEMAR_RS02690 family S-layer glycoprotein [Methanoculleus receptaculi]WOX58704.1 MEMAR_RS02690 family S-layer glycoprotein [Methanoculleus receptaculi]